MSKIEELARKVREAKLAHADAEASGFRHRDAYDAAMAAERKALHQLTQALEAMREAALKEGA